MAEQTEGAVLVQATLNVLGGKWKLLILWHLKDQSRRFGELKRLIPEVTEKMLIQQLRELEKDEIVNRHVYQDGPLKVEYSFTAYGRSLEPVLHAMRDWGAAHLKRNE